MNLLQKYTASLSLASHSPHTFCGCEANVVDLDWGSCGIQIDEFITPNRKSLSVDSDWWQLFRPHEDRKPITPLWTKWKNYAVRLKGFNSSLFYVVNTTNIGIATSENEIWKWEIEKERMREREMAVDEQKGTQRLETKRAAERGHWAHAEA